MPSPTRRAWKPRWIPSRRQGVMRQPPTLTTRPASPAARSPSPASRQAQPRAPWPSGTTRTLSALQRAHFARAMIPASLTLAPRQVTPTAISPTQARSARLAEFRSLPEQVGCCRRDHSARQRELLHKATTPTETSQTQAQSARLRAFRSLLEQAGCCRRDHSARLLALFVRATTRVSSISLAASPRLPLSQLYLPLLAPRLFISSQDNAAKIFPVF